MTREDREKIRATLIASRNSLLGEAFLAVSNLVSRDDRYADPCDQAAYDQDRCFYLRIKDRESRLLRKIELALDRLDNGEYGICDDCGEEIAIGRLMVRPVAMLCIDCKRRTEQIEKSRA
jgi:DnaK suppressor protein